jgi:ribonuclease P protein component
MKIFSLKENHLFSKTYSLGKKVVQKKIVVYILPDKNAYLVKKKNPLKEKLNRVGITASKKIGGAVERNRAKRIIREAYRRLEKENDLKKGLLVVISARSAALYAKTDDIYRELLDAAQRLDLISEKEIS